MIFHALSDALHGSSILCHCKPGAGCADWYAGAGFKVPQNSSSFGCREVPEWVEGAPSSSDSSLSSSCWPSSSLSSRSLRPGTESPLCSLWKPSEAPPSDPPSPERSMSSSPERGGGCEFDHRLLCFLGTRTKCDASRLALVDESSVAVPRQITQTLGQAESGGQRTPSRGNTSNQVLSLVSTSTPSLSARTPGIFGRASHPVLMLALSSGTALSGGGALTF